MQYATAPAAAAPAVQAPVYAPLTEDVRDSGEKPLPSISVQAFCDRQETAHCINETTRDWRMKRTNVKIYMGGLPAAIEFYHKENTPSLIIIESGMRGEELFNQLEQLASVCDEGTKVVIIGAANDIRLYRQLMEKGVSDYLVPPLHPLHVVRWASFTPTRISHLLAALLRSLAQKAAWAPPRSRTTQLGYWPKIWVRKQPSLTLMPAGARRVSILPMIIHRVWKRPWPNLTGWTKR
jgi:DNA-binding NarL/FixJ family response regulator